VWLSAIFFNRAQFFIYVTERAKLLLKIFFMNWLAVYTKPRWEKKVAERIGAKGIEVYCPLNKVRKKWSDRYKVVEEPLFKSYVFVKVKEEDRTLIRLAEGVVNFVYSEGRPALIREEEINLIRRFLKEYHEVQSNPVPLVKGARVRVTSGVLMDREGVVIDILNKKAFVLLESLGYELTASFEASGLEPIGIN
jgi:transcription antitermination factor NusG